MRLSYFGLAAVYCHGSEHLGSGAGSAVVEVTSAVDGGASTASKGASKVGHGISSGFVSATSHVISSTSVATVGPSSDGKLNYPNSALLVLAAAAAAQL
ncbi:hypothetical protein DSO57_1004045 [Entomophthora muscae]|uniref:Uncharacterized protein n=1 Tax=Entomophthora muscae TaxID=34485 RepID=A0ACC2U633_9FUNG|nr:hypothetical protein DSO57_1004045 [Entomophthora muscae]